MADKQWQLLSSSPCYQGLVQKYQHTSSVLKCPMKVSVFLPHESTQSPLGCVYFLSGLTCNEDNFITKAGAIRVASELKLILICPDTSPRQVSVPGQDDSWDFGSGAGFYVDATEPTWHNYQMYSYITQELPNLVKMHLPVDPLRCSVMGHSMGGHGALVCGLRNPDMYKSVSCFAPIAHPMTCPWGIKAFTGYLGTNKQEWKQYDGVELLSEYTHAYKMPILVDQGEQDDFLVEQLQVDTLVKAAENRNVELTMRMQPGYDHSQVDDSSN